MPAGTLEVRHRVGSRGRGRSLRWMWSLRPPACALRRRAGKPRDSDDSSHLVLFVEPRQLRGNRPRCSASGSSVLDSRARHRPDLRPRPPGFHEQRGHQHLRAQSFCAGPDRVRAGASDVLGHPQHEAQPNKPIFPDVSSHRPVRHLLLQESLVGVDSLCGCEDPSLCLEHERVPGGLSRLHEH